jgi:hypothetical protein
MSRRRFKPEQIIRMLREAEVGLSLVSSFAMREFKTH